MEDISNLVIEPSEKSNLKSNFVHFVLFRYTCEFNITQYGDQSMDGEADPQSRRESLRAGPDPRRDSVKDILNLGFTAHMESEVQPQLPTDRASAIK